MKKAYFILFCIVCGLIQSVDMAAQRAAAVRKALQNPKYKKVLVVAHRGNWRSSAPENSLAAIDSAIQMKIDIVELDVWKTKDGKLVLMHDNSIRTTAVDCLRIIVPYYKEKGYRFEALTPATDPIQFHTGDDTAK